MAGESSLQGRREGARDRERKGDIYGEEVYIYIYTIYLYIEI